MSTANISQKLVNINSSESVQDIYFLDSQLAEQVALQNNVFQLKSGFTRLQICYYDGDSIDNAPLNLIQVPANAFTFFFSRNSLDIPTKIVCQQNADEKARADIELTFLQMAKEIEDVRKERTKKWQDYPPHQDTYFLDNRVAYQTAVQQNRVSLNHPTITGLQVCYYDGKPIDNGPENLIHVPAECLYDYLINCQTRLPSQIVYPATASGKEYQAGVLAFQDLIEHVKITRSKLAAEFAYAASNTQPVFNLNEPFSVFFLTSHRTQVLQYASKNLAKAFEKLGHRTFVSIEQNAMEEVDSAWHLKSFLDFKPNVIVNINHTNNSWLHKDIFNVNWWQDPMPEITEHKAISWRERDIVLSATLSLDEHLHACGARHVVREHFCIDPEIFHSNYSIARTNKVVFVGSSYTVAFASQCRSSGHQQQWQLIVQQLTKHLENGERITDEILQSLSTRYQVTHHDIYWFILPHAVREACIEWMCENSPIPVEVYGRHWSDNTKVAPFYKGELPHGEAVAEVYNSAKYAVITHAFDVNSQRLAEAAACGCIPVVYDCRHLAEQPHWDDECLFFLNREQLYAQLNQMPNANPSIIGNKFTYDGLAQRIIDLLHNGLSIPTALDISPNRNASHL